MPDLFADLLKQSSLGASSQSKNNSNLTLNDQLKTKSTTPTNGSGSLDMEFLDSYLFSKSTTTKQTPSSSKPTVSSDFDLLSGISTRQQTEVQSQESPLSSSSPSPSPSPSQIQLTSALNSNELLDDFFGKRFRSSESSAPSDQLLTELPPMGTRTKIEPIQTDQDLRDSALAELLDMGFPLNEAKEALDSTSDGHTLDAAISFLIDKADSSQHPTRQQAPEASYTRLNYSTNADNEDLSKLVNDLSTNFMSTASFLFNSGKKKIQEGVEMYRQQKLDKNNGQPLWMKNQQQYKANSIKLPHEGDEKDSEMDPEEIRRLIKQQRLKEQMLKQQKVSNKDLLSKDIHDDDSQSFSREKTPVNDNMRSSPKLSSSHDDIYVSSSRRRRPPLVQQTKLLTSTPISTPQVFEPLIETTPTSKPSLNISPLNPAQSMMFTNSRNTAQEAFRKGDYPKSLDNYLLASQNIPNDHPYQILLYSNIALLYSKLGNPKEQLDYADKGLQLIKICTNNEDISNLSTIFVENNKNMKNLWIKLMTKRAESLEMLEKWKPSKEAYELLISKGENSKFIMDGKNRCTKILNPTVSKPKLKAKPSSKNVSSINNEKLQRVKKDNEKKRNEDEERFDLHDKVELKLDNWRSGNKNNIRGLLCSLDKILWPELNWKNVTLTDLVMDKKVKIYYMKAVAKTHPDKISSSESLENKMIANGVFITLNEAWELFKKDKGL